MSKNHADRPASGFTLIEVIVALAIAGLALGLLIGATGSGLGNATTADRYIVATRMAQSHLAALGIVTPLRAGEQSGDDGGGYSWRITISEPTRHASGLKAAERVVGLYTVDVTVSWREGLALRSVSLASKLLGRASDSSG